MRGALLWALAGLAACAQEDSAEKADPLPPRPAPYLSACVLDPTCTAPLVVAHRSQGLGAPENSLAAFRAGVAAGADVLETDVRQTADGVLVLMHDGEITRTVEARPDLPQQVSELTYAQVQELVLLDPAGQCVDPAASGFGERCRVPRADVVIEAVRGGALLMLEHKAGSPEDLAHLIVDLGATDYAFVFDDDLDALRAVEAATPNVITMPRAHSPVIGSLLLRSGPPLLHADVGLLPDLREEAAALGVKLFVNVFLEVDLYLVGYVASGDPADLTDARVKLDAVLAQGANLVQTNLPVVVRGLIDER